MRVVILGASTAGLAAGALLAQRGCQVTVFDESDHLGGLDGTLTSGGAGGLPGDHLIWGWRSSRALVRLFGSLRDRPGATARHFLKPVATGLQVLGHPHRLDWGQHLEAELEREFPEALGSWRECSEAWEQEMEALRRADVRLPFLRPSSDPSEERAALELDAWESDESAEGSQDPKALRRALTEKPFLEGLAGELPAPLHQCLRGVALAVSWRPVGEVSLPTWLWAKHLMFQEVAVLRHGLDGLMEWLAGRLEAAGGSLRLNTPVRSVKQRGKRVVGVVYQEGRRRATEPADAVVVAGADVYRILPFGKLRAKKRRSVGTLASCLLAVEEEVVAEPMAPLAAYCPEEEGPLLLISHNPARRYAMDDRARHLLTVAWRLDGPEGYRMEMPEELPKRLERLMPFLPGRWEMVAQDDAAGNPLRIHPIPEIDLREFEPTTQVGGLVVAQGGLLPGMATTASLTLGVTAAEAVLKSRRPQSSSTT